MKKNSIQGTHNVIKIDDRAVHEQVEGKFSKCLAF